MNKYFLVLILIFVVFFCFINLTSWPKLWFDEGINIEIAYNFLNFGKLDVMTAPGVFSGAPYAVGTNGYPLTIPLSGVFDVFGFGFVQTRIYMLSWIIAALLSIFYVVRKFFGSNKALISVGLISTFAPFYGNGLTLFGEIPGFLFLAWGLFFLIRQQPNYWLSGLLFSLSAVTKPSAYLLLFPSFLIFLFLEERSGFFKKLLKFTLAALPPFLIWILLAFPNPFSLDIWHSASLFYMYNYGSNFNLWENVFKNLILLFTHSTLIYFLLLVSVIIFWFFKKGREDNYIRKLSVFFFCYAFFAFLYYLKSPGWLRYLMGFELLVFVMLPTAFEFIFKKRFLFYGAISFLLIVQLVQLFFFRSDYYSTFPQETAVFVNEQLARDENYKVGFLNAPDVAGLVDPLRKYHLIKVGGPGPAYGENPLSFRREFLPQFICFEKTNIYVEQYKNILEENYYLLRQFGGYKIYEFK